MSQYKYVCDECKSAVKTYTPQKCDACKINLCDTCKRKHKFKLCQWCEEEIPVELMARRRTAIILMIITPILLLLLPVPIPAGYMIITMDHGDQTQVLIMFGLIILSLIIYPIVIVSNKKKIIKTLKGKHTANIILSNQPENQTDSDTKDPYK
jgi:hypothetical protein